MPLSYNIEPTAPNNGEQIAPPSYAEKADQLVALANEADPEAQLDLMRQFVGDVYTRAETGDITNGREGEDHVVYTPDVLDAQLKEMVKVLNTSSDESNPLMRVPRAGGLRPAFDTLLTSESTATALMKALEEKLNPVSDPEAIKAPEQNEIVTVAEAQKIGGTALESAGLIIGVPDFIRNRYAETPAIPNLEKIMTNQPIPETGVVIPDLAAQMSGEASPEAPKTPEQQLIDLTENLSEDDRMELRSYASSHESMVEARKDGEGENAQYFEQQKGQAQRAMSPAAAAIKGQYLGLWLNAR